MTDPLDRVRVAAASRLAAQAEWEAAMRSAAQGHTLAEVARAAGISRARVSQIIGPTGRRPGRRKRS